MKKLLLLMLTLVLTVGASAETTKVWSGSQTFSDYGDFSIAKEQFTNLKIGDKIAVVATRNATECCQIVISPDWSTKLPGADWNEISDGYNSYEVKNPKLPDEELLNKIKEEGLHIQGKNITVTEVSILSPSSACVWSGNYEFRADGDGWQKVAAQKFSNLELGDYLIVRVEEVSDANAQIGLAGDGPWIGVPGASWGDAHNGDNAYVINKSEVLASIKAGGLAIQGKYYTLTNVYIAKPITIKITTAGIGSMILPFAAEVPQGMQVYEVGTCEGNTLHLNSVDAIAANTPYIIKGTAKNYEFVGVAEAQNFQYTVDNLCGTYENINAPANSYVLQNGDEGAGFYPVVEGSEPTVTPYHAYLTGLPTEENGAKLILDFDGEVTGIKTVDSKAADSRIYNLSGQLVNKAQKGIVVMNGKKYLVK